MTQVFFSARVFMLPTCGWSWQVMIGMSISQGESLGVWVAVDVQLVSWLFFYRYKFVILWTGKHMKANTFCKYIAEYQQAKKLVEQWRNISNTFGHIPKVKRCRGVQAQKHVCEILWADVGPDKKRDGRKRKRGRRREELCRKGGSEDLQGIIDWRETGSGSRSMEITIWGLWHCTLSRWIQWHEKDKG